jgi:uncharacterized protein
MATSTPGNESAAAAALPGAQTAPHPVAEKERIVSIDALRGFALLGILYMNIQAFSMVSAAYLNPTVYGDLHGANYAVWLAGQLFADLKFLSIFSMLFGAGIFLMTSRVEASGRRPAALHYRRMGWLALFGLLHGSLLWYGDILYDYALCGMLVYLFRKRQPRTLAIVGVILFSVAPLLQHGYGYAYAHMTPREQQLDRQGMWQPTAEQIAKQNAVYRSSWLTQMLQRLPETGRMKTIYFVAYSFWREASLMLIGIALFKLGVFSAKSPNWVYGTMIALGAFVGLPVIYYGVHRQIASGWAFPYSFISGQEYNYWASMLVSFAWVGAIMLACRSEALLPLTRRLAAVGRMAFSNYIFDTLVCTTIFYGHGFGLFGKVERVGQVAIVLAIWAFQLVISPVWLRYFLFGPLEWLWRSLTYLQWEPFRRPATT